jgi:hypothetical protein
LLGLVNRDFALRQQVQNPACILVVHLASPYFALLAHNGLTPVRYLNSRTTD